MNAKNLFLISLISLIVASCSFLKPKIVKTEKSGTLPLVADQSINGVDYHLVNMIKYHNTVTPNNKDFQLENKIRLYGMNQIIEAVIYQSDFENKIDFKNIEKLAFDSVSFSINKNKDKIDLKYFLNLGNQRKTVIFELLNDGETWNVN